VIASQAPNEPLSKQQRSFLRRVAAAIPRLFQNLEEGNVKSELILGLRRVRSRDARLKLVAELVDPGLNPLQSHGARDVSDEADEQNLLQEAQSSDEQENLS